MSYQLEYIPQARKDIRSLPSHLRNRARALIEKLGNDPYPPRSVQLRAPLTHLRRVPLEAWRIIY